MSATLYPAWRNSATANTAASYRVACEMPSRSVKEDRADSMLSHKNSIGERKANSSLKFPCIMPISLYCENTSSAVDLDACFRLRSLASAIGDTIHRRAYLQVLPNLRADAQWQDSPQFECPAGVPAVTSVSRHGITSGSVSGICHRPHQGAETREHRHA